LALRLLDNCQLLDLLSPTLRDAASSVVPRPFVTSEPKLHFARKIAADDGSIFVPSKGVEVGLLYLALKGPDRIEVPTGYCTSVFSPVVAAVPGRVAAAVDVLADKIARYHSRWTTLKFSLLDRDAPETSELAAALRRQHWRIRTLLFRQRVPTLRRFFLRLRYR